MHRFYNEGDSILKDGDFHHAINVLRLSIGDEVELIKGLGQRFKARIRQIDTKLKIAHFEIIEKINASTESSANITLIQCIPRLDKLSFIVESATQLGVSRIILAQSARTQSHHPKDRWEKKIENLCKLAKMASELASREIVPKIEGPIALREALSLGVGVKMIPWELERDLLISSTVNKDDKEITISTGPEGGLEHAEIEMAKGFGFIPVTLGPRILRAELAPVVALAEVLAKIEAMN